MNTNTKTKEYRVTRPFWNGPHLMSVGDTLQLTDDQAKYRGAEVELVEPAAKPKRAAKVESAPAQDGDAS